MSASTIARDAVPRRRPARVGWLHAGPSLWPVAGLTLLGAAIRFYYIGHQGFWFDEGNTALLVRFSPGAMLGLIPHTESTPPLYYGVAWLWTRLFGDTEAGLRSLSALAGTLTVPVAYGAAAKLLWSRRAGLIACALTACNPFLIWYSQEGRSYELLVLLTALSLLGFAYARANPAPRVLAGWVIACGLALATHYYAAVAVVPQALWLLWEHRRLRRVQIAVALALLCGAALIPLALSQNATGRDSWIPHSPFGLRLAQIIPQFLIGTGAPARQALKFAAMAVTLVAVLALLVFGRGRSSDDQGFRSDEAEGAMGERSGGLLAAGLAVSGFVITLLLAAAGSDFLITRNIIALWLPAAVAVAAGLALLTRAGQARRLGWVGPAMTAALCAMGLAAAIGVDADRNLQRPDWRPVARALGPGPAPGSDRLLLIQHYRTLLPLSLYMPHLKFLRGPTATAHHVTQLDVITIRSPQQPLCWWGAACNLIPSQMQSRYAIRGFHVLWRRQVEQFTILRLVAGGPTTVSAAAVGRALKTTTLHRDDLLVQRSAAG